MSVVISIINQKGGVGKTTTCINLSTAFAAAKKNVLIIDMDPQGNASTGLNISYSDRTYSIYEAIYGETDLQSTVKKTSIPFLSIVPSKTDLFATDIELSNIDNKEFILKRLIENLEEIYDFIIIDCPPSLSILSVNALVASDSLIIPLQTEFFAMEGLSQLIKTISLVKERLNKKLEIEGILLTMVDRRNNISIQVANEVKEHFGDFLFDTFIPRNVKLSEAPSHGVPAIIYDTKCVGSRSYIDLAREIIIRYK